MSSESKLLCSVLFAVGLCGLLAAALISPSGARTTAPFEATALDPLSADRPMPEERWKSERAD